MKTKCKKCGNVYEMGYNGSIDGCDKCLNIKRDRQGRCWTHKERKHGMTIINLTTGKIKRLKWKSEK